MKRSPALVVFYKLALFLCLMVTVTSCAKHNDPAGVAEELAYSFINADLDRAKAVTVPEQWERLEKEMKGRKPFECLESDWEDTGLHGSGFYDEKKNEWTWGFLYRCASSRTPYSFQINDILVEETKNGWKIHDWGNICEEPDLPSRFCQ